MDSFEDLPISRLICPALRTKHNKDFSRREISGNDYLVIDSSYYYSNAEDENSSHSHHIYPLFWCNNEDSKEEFQCGACRCRTIGTTYYFCNECDKGYHKECVESPSIIKSIYHPKHHLQLIGSEDDRWCWDWPIVCFYCGHNASRFFYYCFICDFSINLVCARKPPVVTYKKRHEHTLNYFARKSDLICDVCGVLDSESLVYLCLPCGFVVHIKCIYLPFVIRISPHDHRIGFTYSSPSEDLSCGVCRQKIDENYGKYSCVKDCSYVVHSKCATRYHLWDGKELDEEPEELYETLNSFEVIGDGIIRHFSHSHHMRFEKADNPDILYDGKKRCKACTLPLYGGDVYICMKSKCDFLLHEACANLPQTKKYMAYPYPFILQVSDIKSYFVCEFCRRYSCGFRYVGCKWDEQQVTLDARCAAISEPFDHQYHPHPLFLTNEQGNYNTCSMCGSLENQPLNCIDCDFVMCFHCATLPYKVRYEHDEHFLALTYQENESLNWCEVCEETVYSPKWIYTCNECGIALHIKCLFGNDAPPRNEMLLYFGSKKKVKVIPNNRLTRPICNGCGRRCKYEVIFRCDGNIFCSFWELCISINII